MTNLKDQTEPLATAPYVDKAVGGKLDNIAQDGPNQISLELKPDLFKAEAMDESGNDARVEINQNYVALGTKLAVVYITDGALNITLGNTLIQTDGENIILQTDGGNLTINSDGDIYSNNPQENLLINYQHTNQPVDDDNKLATMADLSNALQTLKGE